MQKQKLIYIYIYRLWVTLWNTFGYIQNLMNKSNTVQVIHISTKQDSKGGSCEAPQIKDNPEAKDWIKNKTLNMSVLLSDFYKCLKRHYAVFYKHGCRVALYVERRDKICEDSDK